MASNQATQLQGLSFGGNYKMYLEGKGGNYKIQAVDLRENLSTNEIPGLYGRIAAAGIPDGTTIDIDMYEQGAKFSGPENLTIGGLIVDLELNVTVQNGKIRINNGTWTHNRADIYDFSPMWSSHRSLKGNVATAAENIVELLLLPIYSSKPYSVKIEGVRSLDIDNKGFVAPKCFPSNTLIATKGGASRIADIRVGDHVWAFDEHDDLGRGDLVPKRVTRLFRNVTDEWIKLTWCEGDEEKELVTTPGHHFLDQFGEFPAIEKMLLEGRTTVVLASGELTEVTAERIVYSAESAHLFEQAQMQGVLSGNAALKAEPVRGWQTYNFEVEDLHTYVAGGVRVHNESEFASAVYGDVNHLGSGVANTAAIWDGAVSGNATAYTNDGGLVRRDPDTGSVYHTSKFGVTTVTTIDGRNVIDKSLSPGYGLGRTFSVSQLIDVYKGKAIQPSIVTNSPATGIQVVTLDKYGYVDKGSGVDATSEVWGNGKSGVSVSASTDQGGTVSSDGRTGAVSHTNEFGVTTVTHADGRQTIDHSRSPGYGGDERYTNEQTEEINKGNNDSGGGKPIVIDLDGNGIQIAELDRSTVYMDAEGDGLLRRTAWADVGDGVLFFDPDNKDAIVEKKQYVFTEWDPTATSDMEALASIFDSNGDGVLNAADDDFDDFKVLVTNQDGSTLASSLTDLGITEIDLTADATNIELSDGSRITGRSTFTRSDGTTGAVGDTLLVAEGQSHRVEQSETIDSDGNRVVTVTAFDLGGAIAYTIHSVTRPDGTKSVNRYDDDGDGVVDRIQEIVTLTNSDGSSTETESNYLGSDITTAVLQARVITTTSADGSIETIDRDTTGGGWIDKREIRTTHSDDRLTIVLENLAQDGSTINSSSETVSSDGLSRGDGFDEDGDGDADMTTSHQIQLEADGSRAETIEISNEDGSLRSSVTETVSANGRSKIIERDLDGDGSFDLREVQDITVASDGQTTSVMTIENGDGSTRSSMTMTQSSDTLSKTSTRDLDGDGDIDLTVAEVTTINADTSRETLITTTNSDGSIRGMAKEVLSADKVSSETWEDLNQNGLFESTDLVSSVVVDPTSGDRTASKWLRNPDGTVRSSMTSVISEDGLEIARTDDLDGDGDVDTSTSDITTVDGSGASTRVLEVRNQDGSLRTKSTTNTSADALTKTITVDVDGDGQTEEKTVDVIVAEAGGAVSQTLSRYSGDDTLIEQIVTQQSSDRRTSTVSTDDDGDGVVDHILVSSEAVDGATERTETSYSDNGTIISQSVINVSANGLELTNQSDLDGDLLSDLTETVLTQLNSDGSRLTTQTHSNQDGSVRSRSKIYVSDDELETSKHIDADGDGVFERENHITSTMNSDGSIVTTEERRSSDNTVLRRSQKVQSDDELITVTRTDADGDGEYDLIETVTNVWLSDGDLEKTTELRDANDFLRSKHVSTTSDNGRSVTTFSDINGDGADDVQFTKIVSDDGSVEAIESNLNSDGILQSRSRTVTSSNGLSTEIEFDRDGDDVFESKTKTFTVLNADGSKSVTSEVRGKDNSLSQLTETITSDNGLSVTTREDIDGNGTYDFIVTEQTNILDDGSTNSLVQETAADGTLISSVSSFVSKDGKSSTINVDADGDGLQDNATTIVINGDGDTTTTSTFNNNDGTLLSKTIHSVSENELVQNWSIDRDGNGTADLTTSDVTTLSADGSQTRVVTHRDSANTVVATERYVVSDDQNQTQIDFDLDGDGVNESLTVSTTTFDNSGATTENFVTKNQTGITVASTVRTTVIARLAPPFLFERSCL